MRQWDQAAPQHVRFDLDHPLEQALEITSSTQEEAPDEENPVEKEQNDETHATHGTNDTMIKETTKETNGPFYKSYA